MTNIVPEHWWCETGHLLKEPSTFCVEHRRKSLTNCECGVPIGDPLDGTPPSGCGSCNAAIPWVPIPRNTGWYLNVR